MALFLAFALNFILLFYKVKRITPDLFVHYLTFQRSTFCHLSLKRIPHKHAQNIYYAQTCLRRLSSVQVSDSPPEGEEMEGSGLSEGSGMFEASGLFEGSGEEADGSGMSEGGDENDEDMPIYFYLEESTGYMQPTLAFLAALHTVISFICIIGYNCLKV